MLTAQSRHKSYTDERRKDLEFDVGDMVFLKVAPMKGVLRFEKGKLSPRFVGLFEILERIGPTAYRLVLSLSFSAIHDVVHVSMLRKYVVDLTHIVNFEPLQINENLSYEEQPIEILAREVKLLLAAPSLTTTASIAHRVFPSKSSRTRCFLCIVRLELRSKFVASNTFIHCTLPVVLFVYHRQRVVLRILAKSTRAATPSRAAHEPHPCTPSCIRTPSHSQAARLSQFSLQIASGFHLSAEPIP
ncbi:pol protein [Cucumis melo var. makuwa]|uniref:Pol protein n=1 Tax=Cucumis melo var. makuwa TaxID=1194695 RepID=A0A5D3CN04_CUCMM|nr:pol protein [Cucumis melo var. makuwa]TYK11619.1 pol protein [Cucumis melo var. makuwa]